MPFTTRYTKTDFLKLVHVGNTLGMAGPTSGFYDAKAFISLEPSDDAGIGITSSTDSSTRAGTTTDWRRNGSWANLNPSTTDVPNGSTVDYALLVWGTQVKDSTSDLFRLVDTATLTLGLPTGATVPITADTTMNASGASGFLIRAREVTSTIAALPNTARGNYSISGIPCDLPNNGCGWVIIIVYRNPTIPLRNVTVFQGSVSNGETSDVSGFLTPLTGPVNARAFTMALWGDSGLPGDNFQINSTSLQGSRNPLNNFYCSQVCDYQGNLLTNSSFGNLNCTAGIEPVLQRAVFDITNVNATNVVGNDIRSTTVGITGTSDLVTSGAAALEIDTNSAVLSMSKTVNKANAIPGEVLDYTIVVQNIGAAMANSVRIYDTIPSGTILVPNSTTVNGNLVDADERIFTGIFLGILDALTGTRTIRFSVEVYSNIPLLTTIPNIARTSFVFIADPSLPSIQGNAVSNTVNTFIDYPNATITKSVNQSTTSPGGNLRYTAVIRNASTQVITSLVFLDTIPTDTTFVTNSLTLNGVVRSGANPSYPYGFIIGTLNADTTATITFDVSVNNNATSNTIRNNSTITYGSSDSNQSNEVTTSVSSANLTGIRKIVNKSYAKCGDELLYTIVLPNSGNLSAQNITLFDTIPNGTTFISNSVTINGVTQTGANPLTGISIPTINPGNTTTVTFKVIIPG